MSAPVDPRRTHAVVVAVERYRAAGVSDVPGLASGADRFTRWLTGRGVPKENITVLGAGNGPEATQQAVEELFTGTVPGRRGDLLWIVWAGHGVLDSRERRRLFLADARDDWLRTLDLDAVVSLYGSTYLSGFPRQILVIDACQTHLPAVRAARLPDPMSLPPRGERTLGGEQVVCVAAAPGEAAAYAGGRPLFTEAFIDCLEEHDDLSRVPGYDEVEERLARRYEETGQGAYFRQHPIRLTFVEGDGTKREGDVLPRTSPSPFRRGTDGSMADDPLLSAYLRWLSVTHRHTEASVAGVAVPARLSALPWSGELVPDESGRYARRREIHYLRARTAGSADPVRAETAELAARPLPTHLAPVGHVDLIDLTERQGIASRTVLDSVWRSVVLGDPGSGKTTLARRLAVRAADQQAMAADPMWRLPVLCRATALAAALREDAGDHAGPGRGSRFGALAARAVTVGWNATPPTDPLSGDGLSTAGLERLAIRAAAAGRLLLVVDGLDEVATRAERADLVGRLNRIVETDGPRYGLPTDEPGNQLLITSRFVGYYATEMTEAVQPFILRPMDAHAMTATGEHWLHRYAMVSGLSEVRAAALAERFRALVRDGDQGAAGLATNPYLLVSLLSAIASGALDWRRLRARRIARGDLYAFVVADALGRALVRLPGADRETLRALQAAVAYRIHRGSPTGVLDREQLTACVTEAVTDLPAERRPDPEEAEPLLEALGLLTQRGQGLYGFLHLTLEEHLAGCRLVSADPVERIRAHVDDPRWVEPIRLGLAELGRSDPARLRGVLTDLLTGPGSAYAAQLLAGSLHEIDAVTPEHLELLVGALLRAENAQTALENGRGGATGALAELLSLPLSLPGDRRPADIVADALAAALVSDSAWLVARAAATVESLRLYTRRTAEALFHAQHRDAAQYGWATVRALQSMACWTLEAARTAGDRAQPVHVLAALSDEDRRSLAAASVVDPDHAPDLRPPRPLLTGMLIPRSLQPLRTALTEHDGERLELITAAPPGLLRVLLCLYGGVPFHDTGRWRAERARLTSELLIADADDAARHAAAVRLDTVVASALAGQTAPEALDPRHITVDSPLTPLVVSWIDGGTPTGAIAAELRRLAAAPGADANSRGDALAALCVLGEPGPAGSPGDLPADLDEETRSRLVWRLTRASFVLGDACARLAVGPLVSAFEERPATGVDLRQLARGTAQALGVVSGAPASGGDWSQWGRHVPEALVAEVCGSRADKAYALAVILDVHGRAIVGGNAENVVHLLRTAHLLAPVYPGYTAHWDLDPFAPPPGPDVAEALTALDGLAAPYTFLRCWLLDRMAPLLIPAGYAVEAICLALRMRGEDEVSVDRTVRRYVGGLEGIGHELRDPDRPTENPSLHRLLDTLADRVPDPWARGRARLLLARERGMRLTVDKVIDLVTAVPSDAQRLRLLELAVSMRVSTWRPETLRPAWDCVPRIADPLARALASARLARAAPDVLSPASARQTLEHAVRQLADSEELAPVLLGRSNASAPVMLRAERGYAATGSDARLPHAWAVLSCAALCSDTLAALQPGTTTVGDESPEWEELLVPRLRERTAAELRRSGRRQEHVLGTDACRVLDELLDDGHRDLVADLMAGGRISRVVPEVERWRASDDRRIADLATLLVVEAGHLDTAGVESLPRLLSDPDRRVALRTGLAIAGVSRGSGGGAKLYASRLGARTLTALVRVVGRAQRENPRESSDLYWALCDVVHDSPAVLAQSLELLMPEPEGRRRLLRRLLRVTPETLAGLPGLIAGLPVAEQVDALTSLQTIAVMPGRSGVRPEHVADLRGPLEDLAAEVVGAPLRQILALLGLVLPPTDDSLELLAAHATAGLGWAGPGTGSEAVGAAYGLGLLLQRAVQTPLGDATEGTAQLTGRLTVPAMERALATLRGLAAGADEELAVAAVAGLSRVDDLAHVDEALAAGHLDPVVALEGRLAASNIVVFDFEERRAVQRIAAFVRQPPGMAGADAERCTDLLTRHLLDGTSTLLTDRRSPLPAPLTLTDGASHDDPLAVLAALARAQPAALRTLVDAEYPHFREQLVNAAETVASWVVREFAARLLVLLGDGDAGTVGAVLGTVADTDTVRQGVLADLGWWDHIRPDGLALLVDAVDGEHPERCYFAVRILMSLLRQGVLDGADHAAALRAVQRALERPDGDLPLLFEHAGDIVSPGSFTELCRAEFARLLGAARPAGPGLADRPLILEVTDASGLPLRFAVPGRDAHLFDEVPFSRQVQFFKDVRNREVPDNVRGALERAAKAAHAVDVPLSALLRLAAEGP
ncbi:NACHT domain-containing protein [Streptomyces sp. NPDC049936]|uniref:NACHT domain-containing protein n=1 Tax=Streptomyces sp. NPDC049936 TaxID=3365599 RepID=UPI003798FC5C